MNKIIKIVLITLIPILISSYILLSSPKSTTIDELEPTTDELIQMYANKYGQDAVLAKRIIKAESQIYQDAINLNYRDDGTVWSADYCLWQINDYYHDDLALSKGWDYKNNTEDCIEMGFYLLKRDGTSPWGASKYKWNT